MPSWKDAKIEVARFSLSQISRLDTLDGAKTVYRFFPSLRAS